MRASARAMADAPWSASRASVDDGHALRPSWDSPSDSITRTSINRLTASRRNVSDIEIVVGATLRR